MNSLLLLRITLCSIILFLNFGCTTTESLKERMDTWLEQDINQAMTQWGPPSRTYTMPNGNKQYTWLYTGNTVVTTHYFEYLNMVQSGAVTYWCEITLTTKDSGYIRAWNTRGNSC